MKKNIIGIIGGGNMGEALIKGIGKRILVSERDPKRKSYLSNKYHVTFAFPIEAASQADVFILAVKPQDMDIVLDDIKEGIKSRTKEGLLLISIAAGLTTKFFEDYLGNEIRVVRTMPNMPAFISESITGICAGKYATVSDLKLAQEILGTIGQTVVVKENMMDAITAVSGSGPAYVFLFVEQWINAAEKLGFDKIQARQLVYKTLVGSAHLLEQSQFSASELRVKVTSKGGTTQAALDVFSKGKFDQLMHKALLAAKKRAKDLAK